MGEWWKRSELCIKVNVKQNLPHYIFSELIKLKKWMYQNCENLKSWASNTLQDPNIENSPCISVSEADTSVNLPEKIRLYLGAKQ
jgi:hypothetical protein